MANRIQSASVFNLTNRLEPARAEHSTQKAKLNQLLIDLSRDLQASLEIEEILYLFLNRIRTLVPVDGINYSHEESDIQFSSAVTGKHKVSYQLNTEEGSLGLIAFTRHRRYRDNEILMLEDLMSSLMYPLRNSLKYHSALKAATTDPLTLCGNRQALDAALHREIDLALRDKTPLSIIMFDFDHFKKVNDDYGHQCGDDLLKQVAMDLLQMLRKTDLLFRYGGEEFLILLHKTDLEGAAQVAEKVRRGVSSSTISYKNQKISTTISSGVATLNSLDCVTSIIERADKALYAAKRKGRNQACCAE